MENLVGWFGPQPRRRMDIPVPPRNRLCRAAGGAPWGEAAAGRFGGSMSAAGHVFAGFELVDRAAVRALGLAAAAVRDVEEHARVRVPQFHAGHRAGTEDAAVGVQVLGDDVDHRLFAGGCVHAVQTLLSQCAYFGLRPLTMSKNAAWIFCVRGPR